MIENIQAKHKENGDNYEPDLVMFYSDYSGQADLVVIEFKKASAPTDEKVNASSELARNIGHILKDYNEIRRDGYVITQLDSKTVADIQFGSGMKALFTNNSTPYFYNYNDNIKNKNGQSIDCHTYILSLESLEADARARNSTFLKILTDTTKKEAK